MTQQKKKWKFTQIGKKFEKKQIQKTGQQFNYRKVAKIIIEKERRKKYINFQKIGEEKVLQKMAKHLRKNKYWKRLMI